MTYLVALLSLMCFLLCPNDVYGQQEFFPFLAEITDNRTNVRAGQSKNFEKLCQLNAGDEVVVVGRSYSWYKVKLPPFAKSFISEQYVQLLPKDRGGIVGNRVNVRAGPGVQFSVLGQVTRGQEVAIKGKEDGWYAIEPRENSFGWVADGLIKFKSKDIASYQKRKEKKITKEKKEKETITIEGSLEYQYIVSDTDIKFQIIENNKSLGYLKGPNDFMEEFINQKVKIIGTKIDSTITSLPIIDVSRIELIL